MSKTVNMTYDSKHNIVYIDANKDEFVPAYLKYLLEYHNIRPDAIIVFKDNK